MQPEEQNQQLSPQQPVLSEQPENWQQPAAPAAPEAIVSQAQDSSAEAAPEIDVAQSANLVEGVGPAPELDTGEDQVVRWQATEHIHREKSYIWYVVFGVVVLALIAVAIFLVRSWTFAVLIPVMAATLVIYVMRPPALINYTLSRKGLHINDRLYAFDLYKEFGLIHDDDENSVMLVPRKRFQPGVTVYFPSEVGEAVVDMLAARLPMHELRLDPIDRLIRRLRI